MSLSRRVFVLIGVALATVGVGVALFPGVWKAMPTIPHIEFTASVDLGSCAQGGIGEGRFLVKNAGGGELTVEAFRTSCSCAGVERELDGKYLRVQSLRLGAGEEIELVIRVSVTASAGQQQRIGITFETNDPERPRGYVDALVSRVLGGVVTLPTAVSCGELTVGTPATFTLDIYDNGQTGRRIGSVRSTRPERFSASLVPLTGSEASRKHQRMGDIIARVKITPDTSREVTLDGEVEIVLADEDRRPDTISVTGKVTGDIEVTPRSLVLPRTVDGVEVLNARVRVMSRAGNPVSVRMLSAEEPLIAKADEHGEDVRIEWKPGKDRATDARVRKVRLRIVSGGIEHDREIQVLLRGGGGRSP